MQLPKIISYERAWKDVLSLSWNVVDFQMSSKRLLTSDHPCVYTKGLGDPNCIIALPLSPKLGFFAFWPDSKIGAKLRETPISKLAVAMNESVVGQAKERAYMQLPSDAPDNFFLKHLAESTG